MVEIFDNRVEVTNPGTPLVDVMRIIDNPPKSRNEKLASLMRRLGMCEELGRGWDRMVLACEAQCMPTPRIEVFQENTKVTLFSEIHFSNIPMEDKLWSCYLLIREAVSQKLIKLLDSSTAPRYMRYLPAWA